MSDCLLCGESLRGADVVATKARHGHDSRRVCCRVCSLVQLCPLPTEGELAAFYSSHDYRAEHGPVPITIQHPGMPPRTVHPGAPDYEDALEMMARWRVDWASEQTGAIEGMRLLEIGSGDGRTLAAWAARGLTVTGIEPDEQEAAESVARLPQDARVHAGMLGAVLPNLEPPYDIIVMHHVLEHIRDPLGTLRQLREMLTPQGALVIEVPNVLAPGIPLVQHWQHVHLTDLSEHTLAAFLVRAKMRPVWIASRGNLRAVARPSATEERLTLPHGGAHVAGFLRGVEYVESVVGVAS